MRIIKITLKAARINAGLTQEQVKEKTGISRTTLVGWESGKTRPRLDNLIEVCNLYGVQLTDIKLNETD